MAPKTQRNIVWAEDDPADRVLMKHAISKAGLAMKPVFVSDGLELIQYLRHEGAYSDRESAPRPDLILLDLNMPRVDGKKVLEVLSADHDLRRIPVLVVSTSRDPGEVVNSYDLGANSYVVKPQSFDELVEAMEMIDRYWAQVCEVPAA
jgi:CheY-like chemotaxis protein